MFFAPYQSRNLTLKSSTSSNTKDRYQHQRNNRKDLPRIPKLIYPEHHRSNKIFVHDINSAVTNDILHEFLSQYANVVNVQIVKEHPSILWSYTPYAFVELKSEDDADLMLTLDDSKRYLYGKRMKFTSTEENSEPAACSYYKILIPDLKPVNLTKPCIHTLNNYVLLRIFEYLDLKTCFVIAKVCRHWQDLVHSGFQKRASPVLKGKNINDWLLDNKLKVNLLSISSTLTYCGKFMTELNITSSQEGRKILVIIARLCPVLESLTLSKFFEIGEDQIALEEMVKSCSRLKKLCLMGCSSFNEESLRTCFESLPFLETFQISNSRIAGNYFSMLPRSLRVLHISYNHRIVKEENLLKVPMQCPLLEDLNIRGVRVSLAVVREIGRMCPNVKRLIMETIEGEPQIELTDFKNLTRLSFHGHVLNANMLIKSVSHLEELRLERAVANNIDFSVMQELRVLKLPSIHGGFIKQCSLASISHCKKLEKFYFFGTDEHIPTILIIIEGCPNLKEIHCPYIQLSEWCIDGFVKANKKRQHTLKIIIQLDKDESALHRLKELKGTNYEVKRFYTRLVKECMRNEVFLQDEYDFEDYF